MDKWILLIQMRLRLMGQNRKLLALVLVGPVLVALFTGTVFKDFTGMQAVPIALIDQDDSQLSRDIGSALQEHSALQVVTEDWREARILLERSDIEAIFTIREGFAEEIMRGSYDEAIQLTFLDQNYIAVALGDILAREIMPHVTRYAAANRALALTGEDSAYDETLDKVAHLLTAEQFALKLHDQLVHPDQGKALSADAPAVLPIRLTAGFSLIAAAFFISYGAVSFIRERTQHTLTRGRSAGLPVYWGWFAGQAVVAIAILVIQWPAYLRVVPAGQLFSPQVFFVLVSYGFAMAGFTLLAGSAMKNPVLCQSVIAPGIFFLGLVGGSFWSLEYIPRTMKWISWLSPMYWGLEGLLGAWLYGGAWWKTALSCMVLLAMGLGFAGVGKRLYTRE